MPDTIVRTVELGATITDAPVDETTVLWCDLRAGRTPGWPDCGEVGSYRDSVERRLTDMRWPGTQPAGDRCPRYRCPRAGCGRELFAADTSAVARLGWTTTHRCAGPGLRRPAVDRMTVSVVARELGRSWHTGTASPWHPPEPWTR